MTLDNNPLENKVRPFALGRKNWLFANTPAGAHALATWFSLVETAKANGWKPDRYLNHLLTGLQNNAPADSILPTIPPAD
ncbi:MAG: transposase [Acidobacteria bacterium]|nr:transposase [Bacteroidia bacterium]MCB9399440.1 transposase [Acidobacteriota bacterium]